MVGEVSSRVYVNSNDGSYVQDLRCHPSSVKLYRSGGGYELKDNENGKTLGELRFKTNEVLIASRRNVYSSLIVPLLNLDKSDLSGRAKYIFTKWFNDCSDLSDPSDPNSKRLMNL